MKLALVSIVLLLPSIVGLPLGLLDTPAEAAAVGSSIVYPIAATAMVPPFSGTTWSFLAPGFSKYRTGGSSDFDATVDIPSGGLIESMQLDGCDTSPAEGVTLRLYRCPNQEGACAVVASVATGDLETPGCALFSSSIAGETVDQVNNTYTARVTLGADDS